MEDPRVSLGPQALLDPQESKGCLAFKASREPTEPQVSRGSPEIPAVKGSQVLQASRGPVDPKASSVRQALMASLGPVVCQGRPAPLETRVFPEKPWAPILGPGEMLAYPATPA